MSFYCLQPWNCGRGIFAICTRKSHRWCICRYPDKKVRGDMGARNTCKGSPCCERRRKGALSDIPCKWKGNRTLRMGTPNSANAFTCCRLVDNFEEGCSLTRVAQLFGNDRNLFTWAWNAFQRTRIAVRNIGNALPTKAMEIDEQQANEAGTRRRVSLLKSWMSQLENRYLDLMWPEVFVNVVYAILE